jgi:hypothetical protein
MFSFYKSRQGVNAQKEKEDENPYQTLLLFSHFGGMKEKKHLERFRT